MNTAAHPVTHEEVMALLDGELSAERTQSVSAHLEHCAECKRIEETLRATSQRMAEWKVNEPQQLDECAIFSVAERSVSQAKLGGYFPWLPAILSRRWIWAPALALVVFGLATAIPDLFLARKKPAPNTAELRRDSHKLVLDQLSVDRAEANRGSGDAVNDQYYIRKIPFDKAEKQLKQEQRESATPYKGWIKPEPMIARTVSLSIIVKDFDASRASVDAILARHNGYAAELNVATPEGAARTLQASLRISAPELVKALAELKALGRVEMESQNGEEVTRQHADLVARLKNSRETEQRLQAILTERTGKISDVLSVEQEIARVRGEIEQMEAEQQTLEHRVEFATIDLKLAEEYKAQLSSPAPSVATQVRNASVNGFRNAFDSVLALVLFLAESGPAIVLWIILLFFPGRMLWRRYRRDLALSSILGA
jgi:Domain of unknown function (DUF4349)/Putative zinc-finger